MPSAHSKKLIELTQSKPGKHSKSGKQKYDSKRYVTVRHVGRVPENVVTTTEHILDMQVSNAMMEQQKSQIVTVLAITALGFLLYRMSK